MSVGLPSRPKAATRRASPLGRARAGILLGLLALTAAAWVVVASSATVMDHHGGLRPTMGAGAALFLTVWIAMVAAMMFPAVAPAILTYARIVANRRSNGHSWTPTWVFVSGYLVLWIALGLVAFAAAIVAEAGAEHVAWIDSQAGRLGGALLALAGAYQFSTLKDGCLSRCRSPLAFLSAHWRHGNAGAFVLGLQHGLHCAGCCWALMAAMFPVGMMNMAALAALTAFIFAEKVLPGWRLVRTIGGIALLAYGIAVMLDPGLLPGGGAMIGQHS